MTPGKRPRFTPVKERDPVAVALVGLAVLALVLYAAFHATSLPLVGGGTTYTADFSEAAGLDEGDEVRIAGVKVGEVTFVGLEGDRVKVAFRVRGDDTWIGDRTTAAIAIKTLLGSKYLALDPLGTGRQAPGSRIPLSRTTSPYDVTSALQDLGSTIDEVDTAQLAKSFETLSETFEDSAPEVRTAVDGLSALSKTVSSRDAELARLLKGSEQLTKTLQTKKSSFETLIDDGGSLLGELKQRRTAVKALLSGSQALSKELSGLVADNERQLRPTLTSLGRVTDVLEKNQGKLDRTLELLGPYYRLMGNTLGNGRWFDSYVCGVIPRDYLPASARPATSCVPPKNGAYAKNKGGAQ
ncbi:MCE family protein [Streptomyces sp. SID11385]|uniref:MCE family protein n=1 Tax=Streptomyces sp. SID11385 TaxID=2706031 RepID=UPI0013C98FEF|nr:MCE family protein [Streptomyces sp. SID11385]NEA40577.1 MCE family protein [Streptomyces sp. SID11385]